MNGWLFVLFDYSRGDFRIHNLEIGTALSFICLNCLALGVFIVRLLLFEVVFQRRECRWLPSLRASIDHLHHVAALCRQAGTACPSATIIAIATIHLVPYLLIVAPQL